MKESNGTSGSSRKSRYSTLARSTVEETLHRMSWANCILFESEAEMVTVRDTGYNLLRVSKAVEKIFGKGLLGQKCYSAFHKRDSVCPDCPTEKLLRTGAVVCSAEQSIGDRTFSVNSYPVADDNGKVVAVLEHIVEITVNKEAETRLKQTNAFWNTVFNSVREAVSIIDVADFTIVEVNNAFLEHYGLPREQVIGNTCYGVTHHESGPCSGPEHSCPLTSAVASGQYCVVEHTHFDKDGGVINSEVSAVPIRNEKGIITQVVHVARDITERKKAQQQLILNDRLASIGLLASGIAHEVGNPLTSIMGYANTLPLMAELPAEIKDGLKVIEEESKRAADILANLLTFARTEPSKKNLINIAESINRVLSLRSYHQKSHNIDVYLSIAPDLPRVKANRSQLEQVFYNLISNAEFSMVEAHRGGKLTIRTEHREGVMRVVFTDDGGGISEEDLSRIFTPFFTTKELGRGTGLGLSICLGIVTEHGGKMWAESTPGKGATFIVELPASQES